MPLNSTISGDADVLFSQTKGSRMSNQVQIDKTRDEREIVHRENLNTNNKIEGYDGIKP